MNLIYKNKTKILNIIFYFCLMLIIFVGIFARTKYYFSATPYWLDEILLGSNFTDMRFNDVFLPLGAYQKSPPLFVAGVFICRKLFGMGELSLRFMPYICGICSLLLFSVFCLKNIKNKAGIIAGVFSFAFCIPLVYMCGELKQYGCDVLVTLILMIVYPHIDFNHLNLKRTFVYSIITVLIILTSFPALFTIPAFILSKIIRDKMFNKYLILLGMSVIAAGLFLYLYDISTYSFMVNYWNTESGFDIKSLLIYIPDACKYFIYNFDSNYIICILMFFTAGLYALFKDNKDIFKFFIFVFVFAIIAALMSVYPLKAKICLYMIPLYIFILAKSFDLLILLKNKNTAFLLNFILFFSFIFVYGINIPYINFSGEELAYYNKSSYGRNKSVDDREAVKSFSKILLDNTSKSDKILASEELLFSTKVYKYYFSHSESPDITTYKDVNREDINNYAEEFIKENLQNSNSLWFAGRDNEFFFKCADYRDIERLIVKYNLDYIVYNNNDLYLIHTMKKS